MGTACACTNPTGAKGESTSTTRSGNATCSKRGSSKTGIANGDLVVCGTNQPRIEPSSDGVLAFRAESSRINYLVQSEAIDNAAWTKGPAVGTITQNFAVAPDGTTTAERYQYSNTNNDYVLQGFAVGGAAAVTSVYLRGNGVNGTINMCRGGGAGQCVTCSYVSSSWTRCEYPGNFAASNNVFLGCETSTLGGACAQTGLDVLVWGFQGELGAYLTSYIPTTTGTVTRNADVMTVDLGAGAPPANRMSMAVTAERLWSSGPTAIQYMSPVAANSNTFTDTSGRGLWLYSTTFGSSFVCLAGNDVPATAVTGSVTPSGNRAWCAADSVNVSGQYGTAMSSLALVGGTYSPARYVNIGALSGIPSTSVMDALISRVCIDPDPGKCR
jgi:hypothetical protein